MKNTVVIEREGESEIRRQDTDEAGASRESEV